MELDLVQLYGALMADVGVGRKTQAYILNRLRNEGESVVMTLLPAFSKNLLLSIEAGRWLPFGTSIRVRQGLPIIFRGYLLDIFKLDSNGHYVLKDDACPIAIFAIRQVCEYCYKLAVGFDDSVIKRFTADFVQHDATVQSYQDINAEFVDLMRKRLETFYPEFCAISLDEIARNAHPGPGSFSGSTRDFWQRNYEQPALRARIAHLDFGLRFNTASPRPLVSDRDPDYSEVLFVPKDSRGPRVIVREPYDLLLMQMGFNTLAARALERDSHNRINFQSQETNKLLAQSSSITLNYATLDLKNASDSVSFAVVQRLYRFLPLRKALELFRVPMAKLPDGDLIVLNKLSGMGSGFTFPTMALVIHLAICTHVSRELRLPYQTCMKQVYVYGDDIVIPTSWWNLAHAGLTLAGLTVNSSKSYRFSHFRESCGGDYFHGNDVAPVRLKLASSNVVVSRGRFLSPSGAGNHIVSRHFFLLSLERHARELVKKQLYSASDVIYQFIESHIGRLPFVTGESSVLGRYTEDPEVVLNQLSQSESGLIRKLGVWVAIPVNGTVLDACPYQHMRRILRKVALDTWHRNLFPAGMSTSFGDASLPRKIKLVRRRRSGLVLL